MLLVQSQVPVCLLEPTAGLHEASERLSDLIAGDLVEVEVELLEDGLVEQSSSSVAGPAVQLLWIIEQVEQGFDCLGSVAEPGVEGGLVGLQLGSAGFDVSEPGPDLGRSHRAVACQVEEVLLLHIELGQLPLGLGEQFCGGGLLVSKGLLDPCGEQVSQLLGEPDGPVVLGDGVLHPVTIEVGRGAGASQLPGADEVVVDAASSGVVGHDQPRRSPRRAAGTAPETALEVVVVLAVALASAAALLDHDLHPVEQLLADQRLVAAVVDLAVVGDLSEVVGIGQHEPQLGDRDRPWRVAARSGA